MIVCVSKFDCRQRFYSTNNRKTHKILGFRYRSTSIIARDLSRGLKTRAFIEVDRMKRQFVIYCLQQVLPQTAVWGWIDTIV